MTVRLPAIVCRARRDRSGFTLLEVLLTVGVLSIIMIPVLIWTVLAIQRGGDNSVASDTGAFARVNQFVGRDVASARILRTYEPITVSSQPSNPAIPCAPSGAPDPVTTRAWLVVTDSDGRQVAYLTQRAPSPRNPSVQVTRLVRRACAGTVQSRQEVLLEELRLLPAPNPAGVVPAPAEVPVAVTCEARSGLDEDCGVATLTVAGQRGEPVTVRTTRRISAPRTGDQQPVADIRCSPDCTGERDQNKSFTVVLDGSRSSSPAGTPTVSWTFDDPSIPTQTGLRTNPLTFTCTSGLPRWNPGIKGCVFNVELTITDPRGQTSPRTQQIVVLNSTPNLVVRPEAVNSFRAEDVCFDASGTLDADDPTGAGLTFEWFFDDPVPGAVNAATGSGVPVVDCATEAALPGVVSHRYTQLTGGTSRRARLTVTDNEGVAQTVEIPVQIGNKPPVPVITSVTDRLDGIPSGAITWDGSGSFDPDGNATNTGPSPVSRYEWLLTDANGNVYKNFARSGPHPGFASVTLDAPGIEVAGVYTITLTVFDANDPTLSATTTRVIDVNTRPRAGISVVTPTNGIITPDNGQPSITLNGAPTSTNPGSFDVDDGGFISNYRWEFWTPTTTSRPTTACAGVANQACFLDTGTTPTVTFGPTVANGRVGVGAYRVKLVVKDDSNVENACAQVSPYNATSCIDDPEAPSTQRWWTSIKINQRPTVGVRNPTGSTCPSTCPPTFRDVPRRTDVVLNPTVSGDANPTRDPDGTITSYQWTVTRVSNGSAAPLVGTPNLAVSNPTIQFREPDLDYQVRLTLRVTDDDGGFNEASSVIWVRNRKPTAGITSINSQSQANGFGPAIRAWVTPNPVASPAAFRFDAGPAGDADGGVQSRLWRIWRVQGATRTQVAEFGDNNSGGTTCVVNAGLPQAPVTPLPQSNCFAFDYRFTAYGKYAVDLEVRDNDGGIDRTEIEIRVNRPPTVDLAVSPSDVLTVPNTTGTFTFTPNVSALGDGGAITSYRYFWGNGQNGANPSDAFTTAAARSRGYDTALNNSDGTPATNTGIRGRWSVQLAVTDSDNGVTVVERTVRINRRPVAQLFGFGTPTVAPTSPLPFVRINCPVSPADSTGATGRCQVPAWDASPSFDPDSSVPLSEYRWYSPNFVPADPTQNLLAATGTPTFPASVAPVDIGYTLTEGRQFFVVVKDADNALSDVGQGFRVVANRAPRNVKVDAPAQPVGGSATVQRNVPTTWTVSALDDNTSGAGPTEFTLRFERSDGSPITFRDGSGSQVPQVTGSAPIGPLGGATGSQVSFTLTLPDQLTGARAFVTARDGDGLSANLASAYTFNVVDASPVARITPVSPATPAVSPPNAADTYVFTSSSATAPAFAFQLDGGTSFDPDGGPGGTAGPVSSFAWTITNVATSATVCATGEFPNTGSNSVYANSSPCNALPYGTYRVRLDVWDAPSGTPGRRTGSTTWTVKVNRAPNTPTLTSNLSTVTGLSTPVTFTATASDNAPDAGIYRYVFDFGNGASQEVISSAGTASTTYTYPGFPAAPPNSFQATVTVTDSAGATATSAPRTITVNRAPTAAFSVVRDQGGDCGAATPCIVNLPVPYRVTLSNQSTDTDGSISTGSYSITGPSAPAAPAFPGGAVTFTQPGTYTITLNVTDNNGGTSTTSRVVRVNAVPTASINGPSPLVLQRGVPFQFTATVPNPDSDGDAITTYAWEFLDGTTSLGTDATVAPTRTFNQVVANGTVRLRVTDAAGGVSVLATKPFVVDNRPPTAVVTTSPSPARITPANGGPQVITFDSSASADPDGGTLGRRWSIRDATGATELFALTGAAATPVLQLGPATTPALPVGRYRVVLTVTDGQGGSTDSAPVDVTVNNAPTAVPVATPSLINQPAAPTVTLSGTGSGDTDGTITSYAWTVTRLGGGFSTTTSGVSPAAITLGPFGTYTVSLTVTDNDGGTATATTTVRYNELPTPLATLTHAGGSCAVPGTTPCRVNAPYNLTVNGSASTDTGGSVARYDWRIFDTAALAADPGVAPVLQRLNAAPVESFTLGTGGAYTLRLTVTDNDGAAVSADRTFSANRAPVNVAIAGAATLGLDRGAPFTFQGSATDPDGDALAEYRWTFRDENGAVLATDTVAASDTVSRAFSLLVPALAGGGTGTVELRVVDPGGAVSTVATKAFVVRNVAPDAVLLRDPSDPVGPSGYAVASPGYQVRFSSASTDADGSLISEQLQICPDPTGGTGCSTQAVPPGGNAVTFTAFGTFTVTLTVTDNDGAINSESVDIKINRLPVAAIGGAATLTAPVGVPFTLNGSGSTDADGAVSNYTWVFTSGPAGATLPPPGDGVTISRTFTTPGQYTVQLVVTDSDGFVNDPDVDPSDTKTIVVTG